MTHLLNLQYLKDNIYNEDIIISKYYNYERTLKSYEFNENNIDYIWECVVNITHCLSKLRYYNNSIDLLKLCYDIFPEKFFIHRNKALLHLMSLSIRITKYIPKFINYFKMFNKTKCHENINLKKIRTFLYYCYSLKTNNYNVINKIKNTHEYTMSMLDINKNIEFTLERFTFPWDTKMLLQYHKKETDLYYNIKNLYNLSNYSYKIKDDTIDIVFLSKDFFNRPTGQLVCRFFDSISECNNIKFYLVQIGNPQIDRISNRLKKVVNKYVVANSTSQAINTIRNIKPDVIIDMMGLMQNNVLDIMSLKLAPIQIAWLSYPSTLGMECIDYMIADKDVVPPSQTCNYPEKIIYMPDCYQINDDKLNLNDKRIGAFKSKKQPNEIYVGYLNCNYKITEKMLSLWISAITPFSNVKLVLISFDQDNFLINIYNYWKENGGNVNQIMIWKTLPKQMHLKRISDYLDFCVDSDTCNGHTTSSDILLAGVPIVVLPHNTFAGQVSSSLLNNINCSELICSNNEDYINKISILIVNDIYRKLITNKIKYGIRRYNLFNSKRYFDHFIIGIKKAYDNYYFSRKNHIIIKPLREFSKFYITQEISNIQITCKNSTLKLILGKYIEILVNIVCGEIWINRNLYENEISALPNGTDENPFQFRIIQNNYNTEIWLQNHRIFNQKNPHFNEILSNGIII